MYTWNPPWSNVLLLPLGALSFAQATSAWLVINILLVGISSLCIWWLVGGPEAHSYLWLGLPIAFLFPQTITVLDTGQITTFMLVGVAGFLVAYRRERWVLAGVCLALNTVEPHLVYLWLPLVFLWTLERLRWQVWLGFGLMLTSWLTVLTCYLPSWPEAYSAILKAPPTDWATPTLGGLLALALGRSWSRFLGLALLPAIVPLWWRTRHCQPELVTAGLLPVCLATAVFGWSYDQILLLLPIQAIAGTLVRRELSLRDTWVTAVLLAVFVVFLFAQRIRFTNEVYYFWVPYAVLLVGMWTIWRRTRHSTLPADAGGARSV
jgi:hypothetical protein